MATAEEMARVVLIGVGATLVMDLWTALLKALGAATLNYALVGRWAGHLLQGQLAHASIGKAAPIRGELPLGWAIHYGVGIAFAVLLVLLCGTGWLSDPTWEAALVVGVATIVFPLFVMQPAMGAGIAGSRTPAPFKNGLRSLATHAVFGSGLYLSAAVLKRIWT
ncbi:DUF2938 domain-containing protein [Herbaspirillum camelliae]|uniref:DUF2938 domain-containing protein n=1 Tax=Herbaspirillum camelliae TaxID=1892903 RepID=UPI00094A0882|nr:DUF2938 domain-containing protein [Herbaspirillum camelliae]